MFDDIETIYMIFNSFDNKKDKIEYLEKLKSRNLDFKINFDKLIDSLNKSK